MAGWPRCTRHDGRHLDVYGQCVHVGAPVAIRVGPCPTCGEDVAFSRNLASGRVTVLEAGSDRRHVDPAPVRVELDGQELAEGIAGALYGLMRDRADQRATRRDRAAPEPAGEERSASEPAMPPDAVTIWKDHDGDS